jgi:hypothetical protein
MAQLIWENNWRGATFSGARDRTILGREIRLDDDRYSVVGLMPRGVRERADPQAEI